ncbi:MAG: hypothetical protein A2051_08175 [Desulfovibrionales bacterium GWA2_65_9]|nr:MAG: hypothetical protein A2051_08175 [Desulfovibrionales bacterium GWA2_65_9]
MKRRLFAVSVVLVFLIAVPMLFSSLARAAGSRSGSAEDREITTNVYFALDKEFKAQTGDNTEFVVKTFNGEVTLDGAANEQESINRAVEIARRISGVKSVENRMAVRMY